MSYSSVSINGLRLEVRGRKIYCDGQLMVPAGAAGAAPVSLGDLSTRKLELDRDGKIEGDIQGNLEITGHDVMVVIEGNVEGSVTVKKGNVTVGSVRGSVSASGAVSVTGKVGGSVNTSGAVTVGGKVGGSVIASRFVTGCGPRP